MLVVDSSSQTKKSDQNKKAKAMPYSEYISELKERLLNEGVQDVDAKIQSMWQTQTGHPKCR